MKHLLPVLLTCIAIGGCAQIEPYRTELREANDRCVVSVPPWPSKPSETSENSVLPSSLNCLDDNKPCDCDAYFFVQYREPPPHVDDIPMGIIEFDDQGVLQDRTIKDGIMTEIRKQTNDHGTLTVVFAHGWLNNAHHENKNLASFQEMLKNIAIDDREACKDQTCAGRKVVGVYLAWRGMSATVQPFKSLSFWNRKSRAERVGQYGATEVLADLAKIKSASTINGKKSSKKSKLILIGHSFGGALIYNATQQLLMKDAAVQGLPTWEEDKANKHPPIKDPKCKKPETQETPACSIDTIGTVLPQKNNSGCSWTCKHQSVKRTTADLVILVNPAFEAARFTSLHDKADAMRFPDTQSPILAIFTSETDNATKIAFPLGRYLSSLFTKYNTHVDSDQAALDRIAVGHYTGYLTHKLILKDKNAPIDSLVDAMCGWEKFREMKSDKEFTWDLGSVVLKKMDPKIEQSKHMNPYYNVKVDKEIIKDHSAIWGPEYFMDFIYRFITVQNSKSCDALRLTKRFSDKTVSYNFNEKDYRVYFSPDRKFIKDEKDGKKMHGKWKVDYDANLCMKNEGMKDYTCRTIAGDKGTIKNNDDAVTYKTFNFGNLIK